MSLKNRGKGNTGKKMKAMKECLKKIVIGILIVTLGPRNVLKRYQDYADDERMSVTKTAYDKFVYKNGFLKKRGRDIVYGVGSAFD